MRGRAADQERAARDAMRLGGGTLTSADGGDKTEGGCAECPIIKRPWL
jgi:hypothetical protein